MRRSLLIAIAALLAGTSIAEARRPSTLTMTCAEAAATVATTGAIVLTTGEFTYNRFVAHDGFCTHNENATPANVPTLDTPNCPLGYTCEPRLNTFHGR